MSTKFISFLGTNEYTKCFYSLNGSKKNPTFFIQEALLEHLKDEFSKDDKAIIFLTKDAKEKNWLQRNNFKNETISPKGLKQTLEEKEWEIEISTIDIPDGKDEKGIWKIFDEMVKSVDENDNLYFDITHGFRSLPMLALAVINYLKVLKNCKVKGIFYGAFEALGNSKEAKEIPLQKRIAPIFELTAFDNLLDWTFAVNQFLKNGSATQLKELSEQTFKPLMKETKGNHPESNELKELAYNLETFTKDVATCRGKTIFQSGEKVYQILNSQKMETENRNLAIPLFPLIKKINSKFEVYSNSSEKEKLIGVLDFCLEHNLTQQGLTIMDEGLTTLLCKELKSDWKSLQDRGLVSQLATVSRIEDPYDWIPPASENIEFVKNALELIPSEILTLQGMVKEKRNDINHFGINDQPKLSKSFKDCLEKGIEVLKKIDFLS